MRDHFDFIPDATSTAGLCLTPDNWSEVGINTLSYSLESLLLKPGIEQLKRISNIKKYLGWIGKIVLNATSLAADKNGYFTIVSPFDGAKMQFTAIELIDLMQHLKPDYLLLSKSFLEEVQVNEVPSNIILSNEAQVLDRPAHDAMHGRVYTQNKIINLKEEIYEFEFDSIDSACKCPTCSQGFTKAYLHHLLQHTPLLCQRLLIQHNVWIYQHCNNNSGF